jgi:cyanophycinase-like exopeptidase
MIRHVAAISRPAAFAGLAALAVVGTAPPAAARGGYGYAVVGNPADVMTHSLPGLALMGGGDDVDEAFRWMIAKSGGGDFVVLRASGADDYNPYIHGLGGVDSVETIVVRSRGAATDPFVLAKIRGAEALFFAGGDQWNYVRLWKGTPIEDAIHAVVAKGAPIGGTSAGLAILGEFSFTAEHDTITSPEALADPSDPRVALARDFLVLPGLDGLITDSHFVERDRMGRTLVFLARLVQDGWAREVREIAVDRQAAVLIEPDGRARLAAHDGHVAHFLRTAGPPQTCRPGAPLTSLGVQVYRIAGRDASFDLPTWTGRGGTAYTVSAEAGVLSSTQPGGGIY